MRPRVTVMIALMVPVAVYSFAAGAQTKPRSKSPAPSASATATGSGSLSAPASPSDPGTSDASSTNAGPGPGAAPSAPIAPPAVSVDMNARGPDPSVNGGTYAVRLRDLEQRVDELKDQIRRSHTRLALLSDTILGGGAAGSRADVEFHDEMSSAFQLTRALFVVDGQIQYNRQDDSGALADQKDIPIYSGSVPPGDHTIQVSLSFQGNGFGVFSYLRGYKFEVKSSHAFTALEGKTLTVTATAFEKGGVTTPLEQRPTIEWHEKIQPIVAGAASPAAASPPGASVKANMTVGGGQK